MELLSWLDMRYASAMSEKLYIVTGASSGIGLATVRALAAQGGHVVMIGRNAEKSEAARASILTLHPAAKIDVMLADFASLSSIRGLAANILDRYDHIDVLINNAGIIEPRRVLSQDGIEMTLAVNHLAPFLLTTLLLDRLKASNKARIVNVASLAHVGSTIDFEDIQAAKSYRMMRVYGQSKLANILFTRELAKRLEGTTATANSLHPGLVATNIAGRGLLLSMAWRVFGPLMLSPEKGAATSIYLATSPEVEGVSGRYFVKCKPVEPSAAARNDSVAVRLWAASHALIEQTTDQSRAG